MKQISVRVLKKFVEAIDIASFELVSVDAHPLPAFTAGSHIDVQVADGTVRQYSLCNDPAETHRYFIAVLRDPHSRGGSVAMHDNVNAGDILEISVPKNNFPLHFARHQVFLAGGIGITPILGMSEKLAAIEADFELHYCTRSIERTAFHSRIAQSRFADKVHFHYDDGAAEQKLDLPVLLATLDPEAHLYVCGPAGFIAHVDGVAKRCGWAGDRIHREFFGLRQKDISDDCSFDIKLASNGNVYTVPSGKTVIEVLSKNGIDIPTSCEQGVCGTCITRVLEGEPDHRDVYFSDVEHAKNDKFAPCCSRAKSAMLVLDL